QIQSYFVSYQRCCRTEQIVNITTPDQFGATYMAEITPLAQTLHNSSPTFTNYPPTFICNDFPLNFDHSAVDVDGDLLVYSFCTPLTGGGQGAGGGCTATVPNPSCGPPFNQVMFAGNYSQSNPMGGNPLIKVDPMTGLLTGTPKLLGQYVVGICVQEYRNGLYLGSILRDFQFNVVDCTPTVIADLHETVIGPQHFLAKRCGEKTVTLLNASPITPDLSAWEWVVQLDSTHTFTANTWNLTVPLPDYGEYMAWLYLNRNGTCQDTAFITIQAFPGITADFSYNYDICKETPVTFTDSSSAEATGGILAWNWSFGPSLPGANQPSPIIPFPEYGTYATSLIIADENDCRDTASQLVMWQPQLPPVIPELPAQRVCLPGLAAFPILDSLVSSADQVTWDFGDGERTEDEISPSHLYAQPGIYTTSVALTTAYGCFATDTFENRVQVYASPTAGFTYLPAQPSNLDNIVHFKDQSDSTAVVWDWQFGNAGFSHQPDPVFAIPDTGLVPVQLTVYNADGCSDSVTQTLDLIPKIQLYIPNVFRPDSDSGLGNDRFGALGILPNYSNFHLTVWSRWGELLFETDDPQRGWDGRRGNNRKTQPPGVYIYILTLNGARGESYRFEGTVTLM
ncbi:MAG: PKD domain-containing protein, partial [Saprospiraceae bacterium]